LNRGIKVLQTCALPLGYVAAECRRKAGIVNLARAEGFEPSHNGIRIRCLTAWLCPNIYFRVYYYITLP
jgi:hypothetical protein